MYVLFFFYFFCWYWNEHAWYNENGFHRWIVWSFRWLRYGDIHSTFFFFQILRRLLTTVYCCLFLWRFQIKWNFFWRYSLRFCWNTERSLTRKHISDHSTQKCVAIDNTIISLLNWQLYDQVYLAMYFLCKLQLTSPS